MREGIFNAKSQRGKVAKEEIFKRPMPFSMSFPTFASLLLCVFALNIFSYSQGLPIAAPQAVGMNAAKLDQIDALVAADIAAKKLPGAVVLVGHKGKIVFRKAYGNRSLVPTVEKMTVDTIFDLASLTKPIATATSIMILVEQGKLRLNDTVGMYITDIDDPNAKRITIQQLLTHTSGYRPDFDLGEKWSGREGMLAALKKEKLRNPPGTKFVYSDIGFIVLAEIVERITLEPMSRFAPANIFKPLKMPASEFSVLLLDETDPTVGDPVFRNNANRFAPTEDVCGQQSYLGSKPKADCQSMKRILRAQVHDPTAFRMGGVAGHAGLFSTADDLARYCQMLLNGGVAPVRTGSDSDWVPRPRSSRKNPVATAPGSDSGGRHSVRSDRCPDDRTGRGFRIGRCSRARVGHEYFVLVESRRSVSAWVVWAYGFYGDERLDRPGFADVCRLPLEPRSPRRQRRCRAAAFAGRDGRGVCDRGYADREMEQPPRPSLMRRLRLKCRGSRSERGHSCPHRRFLRRDQLRPTKRRPLRTECPTLVLNGIDVLERDKFKQLEGLKIGLVTNHTGRNLAGKQTIDILNEAPNVKLVALFFARARHTRAARR